jgi:CheY-like chemotaxis protein
MVSIVMVEDDDDIRSMTAQMLRWAGHTVVEAADGAAGLQAITACVPDLVVSDVDVPVISGLELCQQLRARPETTGLPVLLISGCVMPGDIADARASSGAVLVKPFRRADLLERVRKLAQTVRVEPVVEPGEGV